MQIARKWTCSPRTAPVLSVLIGVVYLIAFWVGGNIAAGLAGFAFMLVFSAALVWAGRRSETVRGLLDHRDERIAGIDLQATAVTAVVMIVAVLIAFVVEVARGHDGWPYAMIAAIGGVTYAVAVVYFRFRR
ncbi:MAG TPA: hypothetical protein VHC41_05270 [Mycobacteriales bacterium]|jgi:hypothetical protein|nr:hypothetical protein [Mycobacteriales bacterium]